MKLDEFCEALEDYISNLDTADLIALWNQYVSEANRMDDYIYSMNSFDEMHDGMKPWGIARAAYYSGHFCPADDWYWYNGYGNLVSSDWPEHEEASPYYLDEIIDYIIDNKDDLGNSDIRALLDELETEEDEETEE